MVAPSSPAAATTQGACGFGGETLAPAKNACDTVVAAFFEVNHVRYRDAFPTKARSPSLITTACIWIPFADQVTAGGCLNGESLKGAKSWPFGKLTLQK